MFYCNAHKNEPKMLLKGDEFNLIVAFQWPIFLTD